VKPPSSRAKWLATACVGVVGCSPTSLASDDVGSGNAGADGGAAGPSGGSAGVFSGAAGAVTAGSGAASPGGAAASSGSGGSVAGSNGGGLGGNVSGGTSGTSGGGASGTSGGSAGAGFAGQGFAGAAPSFTELWNATLENGCATPYCHDGSGKGWTGFDKATAYRTLVGAASTTCPGETRVVAGEPSRSVLAAAVTHTDLGACDVPTMPRNRAKLSQVDIDRILAWIRAGARDD
jgi:hypothetical protein